MTEILFVRHGVTAWNKARRFQGSIDIALDDEGVIQANRLARRLLDEPMDAIYASDLTRARQTAWAVAQAKGLDLRIDSGLRERAYGLFEGRTADELQAHHAEAFRRWRAREPGFELPGGGESLEGFHRRVLGAMHGLVDRHPRGRIVAVTHGGVLDCIYRVASGLDLHAPRGFDILNASINRVGWDGTRFHLLDWADVSHLSASLDDVEARGD